MTIDEVNQYLWALDKILRAREKTNAELEKLSRRR